MNTLRETAFAADPELIAPMMRWNVNGQPAGNGWTSPVNNGAFGTDYYHRTGAVKADPYDNKRNETTYFYTDNDTELKQLVGESFYAVTFPKGQLPPVVASRRPSRFKAIKLTPERPNQDAQQGIRARLFFLQMPMILARGISGIISDICINNISNYTTIINHNLTSHSKIVAE
jgi:hypothetical protein